MKSNTLEISTASSAFVGPHLSTDALLGSSARSESQQESELTISFQYSTSADADKAGPSSDAFLVPAVWFELHKTWFVSFSHSGCSVVGFTRNVLVPSYDLSGFTFTTANDVETRNLPLLKEQMEDAQFRLCCDGAALPGVTCTATEPAAALRTRSAAAARPHSRGTATSSTVATGHKMFAWIAPALS